MARVRDGADFWRDLSDEIGRSLKRFGTEHKVTPPQLRNSKDLRAWPRQSGMVEQAKLVMFFDEADRLCSYAAQDEFLRCLRAFESNMRVRTPAWCL